MLRKVGSIKEKLSFYLEQSFILIFLLFFNTIFIDFLIYSNILLISGLGEC